MAIQGSRYLKMNELEDEEFQLFQIDADGGNKTFLSPIMIPASADSSRLSEVRLFIEKWELLDFSFDFWNLQSACRYDRRFEKANKVKSGEVIVVECEDMQGKKPRLESAIDMPPSAIRLTTEASVNAIRQLSDVVDWGGSDEPLDYELGDDFNADLFDAIDEAEGRASRELALKTADRNVAPEAGGPIRLWSKFLFDDLLAAWQRAERSTRAKLTDRGKADHWWWFETWDEGDEVICKIWCNECKCWRGNGKPKEHASTFSNFYRQHAASDSHMKLYGRLIGKDEREREKIAKETAAYATRERAMVLAAISIINAANEKACSEVFVIEGDLLNERLSSGVYKWKCIYCQQLHNLCPQKNNLEASLTSHVQGQRHLLRVELAEEQLNCTQPVSSGRAGRPGWKTNLLNNKQKRLQVYFKPVESNNSSIASNKASISEDKGRSGYSVLCWGLWRRHVFVNGRICDIKPFLLDLLRGNMWRGTSELEFIEKDLQLKTEENEILAEAGGLRTCVWMRAQVANFLTRNLNGPSLATIKRDQRQEFQYVAGENEAQFKHIAETYSRLKQKLNIVGPVPFIIAEDETSIRKMLRWVASTDEIMGFCGVKEGHTCQHNFTMTVGDGESGYNNILDAFKDNVRVGPIVGHASDGDSRRRAVQLADYNRRCLESPEREFRIEWEVLLVKLFRNKYPYLPVSFSRTGTDVCEIFFSKVGGMNGVERAYDFGDLLRSAGSLNHLAEIESEKGGVVCPRAHGKMKNIWEQLHPIPCDTTGRKLIEEPNLADFSQVQTDEDIISALKEGYIEASKLLHVLEMAPSSHCNKEAAMWFRRPWDFEQSLQATFKEFISEDTEEDDNDDTIGANNRKEEVLGETPPLLDVNAEDEEHLQQAIEANAPLEQEEAIAEVHHILHEMQDITEAARKQKSLTDVMPLKKQINPQVPIPGKNGEYIWKARLVSQLNGNPFLSKDRLQRVTGAGNQYYNVEELARLKADPNVIHLTCGMDVAVLFEREVKSNNKVLTRRGRTPVEVSKQASNITFWELGRVQIIKRRTAKGKWQRQKEILDMENQSGAEILLYMYWYTVVDSHRQTKFKYDG
ncbi:hypothetical protein R1sor_023229 [Riccia sorocarpa]|uniref:Uncharacterized protein n=1 Tax=Riccia sorocarpa TaxID=122646 RepID=A0ABD3GMU8_9MARC